MSMLAERKFKQNWVLTPRGSTLDSNNFGQKLMEKMGWSRGKGLGANENGIIEHIKVRQKSNTRGMGFKDVDGWTEHDANFNALLASLGGTETVAETKVSSLEKKSETSRVRVHYKKFTRGKDLSRYSSKDLANIFGKKSLDEKFVENKAFTVNGSMFDYFRKKLPNFGNFNGRGSGNNGVSKKSSDSEEEPSYSGFGLGATNATEEEPSRGGFEFGTTNATGEEPSRGGFGFGATHATGFDGVGSRKRKSGEIDESAPKMKKEKKENCGVSNPAFDPLCGNVKVARHCLNSIEEVSEEIVEEFETNRQIEEEENFGGGAEEEEVKKKKKKVKKGGEGKESTADIGCCGAEESLEGAKKKKKKSVNFEETKDFSKNEDLVLTNGLGGGKEEKPDKRKKKNVSVIDNPGFVASFEESSNGNFEVKRKKKKKKDANDYSLAIDNATFNEDFEENETSEASTNFEVNRKMKKSKKNASFAIDNPNFNPVPDNDLKNPKEDLVNAIGDFEVRRKLKKHKNSSEEDITVAEVVSKKSKKLDSSAEDVGRKSKKMKKTGDFAVDNPNFVTEDDSNETCSNMSEQFEVKRSSKKKKKKPIELAIDNPNFSQQIAEEEETINGSVASSFEVTRTEKKNKKKKSEILAIDNPNFCQEIAEEEGETTNANNSLEVTRNGKKNKKKKTELAIDNPNFNEENETEEKSNFANTFEVSQRTKGEKKKKNDVDEENATFDVTVTPRRLDLKTTSILTSAKTSATKRRKSVRFSDVNEERIIPSTIDTEKNELFDINNRVIANGLDDVTNVEMMARKIDDCQSQIENDMNEAKLEGKKIVSKGAVMKFKRSGADNPRSSYRHLLTGDVEVQFNESNFLECTGYCEDSSINY